MHQLYTGNLFLPAKISDLWHPLFLSTKMSNLSWQHPIERETYWTSPNHKEYVTLQRKMLPLLFFSSSGFNTALQPPLLICCWSGYVIWPSASCVCASTSEPTLPITSCPLLGALACWTRAANIFLHWLKKSEALFGDVSHMVSLLLPAQIKIQD